MSKTVAHFYEFGPFRVDTSKRLLLREGRTVPLTSKAFDTLLTLVSHGGEVVEKNELIRTLWPDTIVEENNLTQNVSMVRKALGEHRSEHRYIVTIPGRGYSFVASVREASAEREGVNEANEAEATAIPSNNNGARLLAVGDVSASNEAALIEAVAQEDEKAHAQHQKRAISWIEITSAA